ncbi:CsgG/HfaB family protein [Spirosoma soli]|uniref:CsgG/HfaB family protein n=1 Tax=Spirosoma soli TaxID=1770529 RepID=A0ABW5MBQ9_9BACT
MKTLLGRVTPWLLVLTSGLTGCSSYFHQPTRPQAARLGEETTVTTDLRQLPPAREKVVAAVYKFRDQTGQYKQTETGAGFSTAISQGTTNILLKALEESGWFVPIERENVGNLLNERKIVRSSVAQYKDGENLPPLLFAGIILEGGVVSYDANIITGGAGLRYFAMGGSTQYRQDRVTVYLRAVATKSGKILKTIYTSKTILSQSVDAGVFRYVRFKRLLEAETGFTTNEPAQMAVTEAIEKAVHSLVLEGVRDGLWAVSDKAAPQMKTLLDAFDKEKTVMSETDVYGVRKNPVSAPFWCLQPYGSVWRYSGDYGRHTLQIGYGASFDFHFTPKVALQLNAGVGTLASRGAFKTDVGTLDANVLFRMLPFQRTTPFFYAGVGMISQRGSTAFELRGNRYYKINTGAGLQYTPGKVFSLRTTLEYAQPLTDELDGLTAGRFNDYYLRASLGVVLNLGRFAPPNLKTAKKP